jgi:hypothetical protein
VSSIAHDHEEPGGTGLTSPDWPDRRFSSLSVEGEIEGYGLLAQGAARGGRRKRLMAWGVLFLIGPVPIILLWLAQKIQEA